MSVNLLRAGAAASAFGVPFSFGHFPPVKEFFFFFTEKSVDEMEERENFVSGFSLILFRHPGGWAMAADKT